MELSECVKLLLQLQKDPRLLRAMYVTSQQQTLARKLVRVKHDMVNVSSCVDRIGGISKEYLSKFHEIAVQYMQLFIEDLDNIELAAESSVTAEEQLIGFTKEA